MNQRRKGGERRGRENSQARRVLQTDVVLLEQSLDRLVFPESLHVVPAARDDLRSVIGVRAFLSVRLARARDGGRWCPERILPATDDELSGPARSGSGIDVGHKVGIKGRRPHGSVGGLELLRTGAETTPEVFLDTTERPETKLEEMVLVGELDGRALVRLLLLGVVVDLGERDVVTGADHLELDGLDDGDDGADDIELDDRSPGETLRLPRRGGILHAKVWRETVVRRARETARNGLLSVVDLPGRR